MPNIKRCLYSKVISGLLVLAAALEFLPVFAASAEEYAHLSFEKKNDYYKATAVESMEVVQVGGRYGKKSSIASNALYIYVNVDDDVLYNPPEFTPIDITVEYYDDGNGSFALDYDSHNPQAIQGAAEGVWRCGEIVKLENTKQWKSYTYHFEDMRFTNKSTYSTDFRLGVWDPFMGFSPEDVVFGSITVKKGKYEHYLNVRDVRSEQTGNIHKMGEPIKFSAVCDNKSDDNIETDFEVRVYDEDGKEIVKSSANAVYGARESKNVEILSIESPDRYGIYKVNVKIKEKNAVTGETSSDEYNTEFSVAMLHDKEDVNPHYGVCQQVVTMGRGDPDITSKLINKCGLSYMRNGCTWETMEKEKGVLKMPDEDKEKWKIIADNGVEQLFLLDYGNELYGCPDMTAPHTDEQIEGFARYAGCAAESVKDIGVKYFEVWNEYNLQAFNTNNEPPETYAKMLRASYKAIKSANPDAVVLGLDTAQIDLEFAKRVFDTKFEDGTCGYDYLDIVSVHPYDWSSSFREQKFIQDAKDLQSLMSNYGEVKPLWITELGFSTWAGGTGDATPVYTREEQASKSILVNSLNKALGMYDMFMQYCFYDRSNPNDRECNWGFCQQWDAPYPYISNAAKELYVAAAAMNDFIGSDAEVKKVLTDDRIYALDFYHAKRQKDIMLLISGQGERFMTYDLGCKSVDVYDMYGNKTTTLYSENGIYGFSVSETAFYVTGNFEKLESVNSGAAVEPVNRTEVAAAGDTIGFKLKSDGRTGLNVSAESDGNLTVAQNRGFEGNEAEINLIVGDAPEGEYTLRVNVTDAEGRIVYSQPHTVTVVPPVSGKISTEAAVEGSKTHWRAKLEITNNSQTFAVSGKCSIKEPADVAEISRERRINDLQPGKTATFLYNLPERVTKRTFVLSAETELDGGYKQMFSSTLDFGNSVYAYNKPDIDGVVTAGEWNGSWIGADEEKDAKSITDWRGAEDLSFSGTTLWDEENFYLMAIVTDDIFSVTYTPQTPHYMYKGDNIQFGIDDRDNINIMDKGTFTEIGLAYVPGYGNMVYRYNSLYGLPIKVPVENAKLEVKNYGTYTVYECQIPWSEIFYEGYEMDCDKKYGFSVLANDNDGAGRRGWIEYTSGIGKSKDAFAFGSMRFSK